MCLQNAKRELLYCAAWTVHQRTGIDRHNICVFISNHSKWRGNAHRRVNDQWLLAPCLPFANGSQHIRVAASRKHSSVTSTLFPVTHIIMVSLSWMGRCWTLPATPARLNDEKVPFSRGTTEIKLLQKPFCHMNIHASQRESLLS